MANSNDIEKEFTKLSDEERRKVAQSWEGFLSFASSVAGFSPAIIPILMRLYDVIRIRGGEIGVPRQVSSGSITPGNAKISQTTSADDRSRKMIDIADFRRRLAGGEYDDAVSRLLGEMELLDDPVDLPGNLSTELRDVLDRGRLLGRSTLCRLNPADTAGSIASSGCHNVTAEFASGQSTSADFTVNVSENGNSTLFGAFPAGWQPLDLVAVLPHVKRNQLLKRLSTDSTIVTPLNEPPQPSGRVPAVTVLSPLPGGGGAGAAVPKPLPTFELAFDPLESRLRISTPFQPGDGDELLVLTAIESEPPAPVILDRSEDTPQLVGYCDLPKHLHGAIRIKVKVSSIDLDHLPELSPEAASLWLATQPMIAMPLAPTSDGHEFMMYEADRKFIQQHPDAVFAMRIARQESEVA